MPLDEAVAEMLDARGRTPHAKRSWSGDASTTRNPQKLRKPARQRTGSPDAPGNYLAPRGQSRPHRRAPVLSRHRVGPVTRRSSAGCATARTATSTASSVEPSSEPGQSWTASSTRPAEGDHAATAATPAEARAAEVYSAGTMYHPNL